jgi:hypothetical protein
LSRLSKFSCIWLDVKVKLTSPSGVPTPQMLRRYNLRKQ